MANKISGYNACTLSVFLILFFSMSLCKNSSIFRKQFSVIVQTECSFQEAQRGMLWALWKNIGLNIYQPWVYVSLKPTWNKHARMDNPFSRGIPGYREYRNTFETDKNRNKPHPVHGILAMQGTILQLATNSDVCQCNWSLKVESETPSFLASLAYRQTSWNARVHGIRIQFILFSCTLVLFAIVLRTIFRLMFLAIILHAHDLPAGRSYLYYCSSRFFRGHPVLLICGRLPFGWLYVSALLARKSATGRFRNSEMSLPQADCTAC